MLGCIVGLARGVWRDLSLTIEAWIGGYERERERNGIRGFLQDRLFLFSFLPPRGRI